MKYLKKEMPLNKKLYEKVFNLCHFSNVRLDFKKGVIFKIEDTNINFIEPHRFIIKLKDIVLILLCYDNLNLYLYNKETPIKINLIKAIIDNIKGAE